MLYIVLMYYQHYNNEIMEQRFYFHKRNYFAYFLLPLLHLNAFFDEQLLNVKILSLRYEINFEIKINLNGMFFQSYQFHILKQVRGPKKIL